jgi:putative DNA primase/helicase
MRRRDLIPIELRTRDQWVVWRLEIHAGRPHKAPYQPSHPTRHASSTRPATWSSFDRATAALDAGRFDGVGYVFSPEDPFTGIDLDKCLPPERVLHPAAAWIVEQLNSYTEVSPSLTGVKIIARAKLPDSGRHTTDTGWGDELAIYDQARFFAVTGRVIAGRHTIHDRQQQLDAIIAASFPKGSATTRRRRAGRPLDLDDTRLLERAFAARNGHKIRTLYEGDTAAYGGDRSRADFALATILAFWTDSDLNQIERLMRGSGLAREKWDETRTGTVWLRRVIEKAAGT